MKILPLVVEGIENKIKKVLYRNQELSNENELLKKQIAELQSEIDTLEEDKSQIREELKKIKIAKTLSGYDTSHARHRINEMLREIQKCYSLLNR